jgi:protochlorophyllide reductase
MCKYRRDFISLWLVITGFAHSTYQKVVLLTGGSKGIGFRCAQALANHHKVVIASRTPPSSDCDFKFEHILLDISNCDEVARFVKAWGDRSLDVLVLNAGIQNTQLERSEDGYELTIATNHIGGYHLCTALLPRVRKGGRVVFVGSGG